MPPKPRERRTRPLGPGFHPVGTRVVRGRDWECGDQDGGVGGEGVVVAVDNEDDWSKIRWDFNGQTNSYYNGKDGHLDVDRAPGNLKHAGGGTPPVVLTDKLKNARPARTFTLSSNPRRPAAPPAPSPEEQARTQEECLTAFYAERLHVDMPKELATTLASPAPLAAAVFEKICSDLTETHSVKTNPRFWSGGALVKQGWVEKRAGHWDFWHRFYAVVRSGKTMTFYTVEDPLQELDETQLTWHSDRKVDLSLCQAVVPPQREGSSSSSSSSSSPEEETGADFRIAGAHLPTGQLELRCETADERKEWVECMSSVCPVQAEPEPEPENMARKFSFTQRIRERTHSHEAAAAAAAAGAGAPLANAAAALALFIPAPAFAGARPGYAFRLGDLGAGYYPDPLAAAAIAAAAAPADDAPLVRTMSADEKARLIGALQTLPIEVVDRVVAIVQEFQPVGGGEINLDALPLPVLWRIKALVDGQAADVPAADDAEYRYQWGDDDRWHDFDHEIQVRLLAAHRRGVANGVSETIAVQIGRFGYRINLGNLTQQNNETGNVRQIRRVRCSH